MDRIQSEHQKAVWAGRSQKERSAIGYKIAATRGRDKEKYLLWKKHISEGLKGRTTSEETKKKLSIALTGRKHTKESRRKMSIAAMGKIISVGQREKSRQYFLSKMSPEELERHFEKAKRELWLAFLKGNPKWHRAAHSAGQAEGRRMAWKDAAKRQRTVDGMKMKWQDEKSRKHRLKMLRTVAAPKISRTMKRLQPIHRVRKRKTFVWYDGPKGKIEMQVKQEVQYAKMLDEKGIDWLYEYCTFVIGPNQRRSWTPDFYLPKSKKFVEIKGWFLPHIRRKIRKVMTHFSHTKFEVRHSKDFAILMESKSRVQEAA